MNGIYVVVELRMGANFVLSAHRRIRDARRAVSRWAEKNEGGVISISGDAACVGEGARVFVQYTELED